MRGDFLLAPNAQRFGQAAFGLTRHRSFSPSSLSGLAAWYDPSDLSTLYQDVAMTIPVTASGQTVAVMRDKSGKGRHLIQTTAAARPTYQTSGGLHWLQGDGVDDLLTGAPFVGGYPVTLAVAFEPIGSTGSGIAGIYQNEGEYKSLMVNTYLRAVDRTATLTVQAGVTNSGLPPKSVAIASFDSTSAELMTQQYATSSPFNQSFGAPSDFRLLSFRNSDHWNGRIFAVTVFDRLLSASEKTDVMVWMAEKSGVTL